VFSPSQGTPETAPASAAPEQPATPAPDTNPDNIAL
jgi:hypothetical protein